MWTPHRNTLLTTLAWLALALATPLAAQDFRLDTDIFIGTSKEPVAGTLTLFSTEPRKIETVSRVHCPPDWTTRMMLSPAFA